MKAVLGFLFILVGVTVGWLVLSGKLPNATPTAPPTPANSGTQTAGTNLGTPNPNTVVQPNGSILLPTQK
jgi:hypothetical protein